MLLKYLKKRGIYCQIHYPYTLNTLKAFRETSKKNKYLKNSDIWSKECLSLPLHPNLKVHEVHKVINEIKNFF